MHALDIELPAEPSSLKEALTLAANREIRLDNLVACVAQDPILTLELLKCANQTFAGQYHQTITNCEVAVVRLGSAHVIEALEAIDKRQTLDDPRASSELEHLRGVGRRVSLVSKIISAVAAREYSDEIQTVSLMSTLGQMLACFCLGETYLELARTLNRPALIYRLAHAHQFDVRWTQIRYLEQRGFPNFLLFCLDRDLNPKSPDDIEMRFITDAAFELVDAFDNKKWDRYRPNAVLPTQSSFRLLQLSDNQYLTIYERSLHYLDQTKLEEEQKRSALDQGVALQTSINEADKKLISAKDAVETLTLAAEDKAQDEMLFDDDGAFVGEQFSSYKASEDSGEFSQQLSPKRDTFVPQGASGFSFKTVKFADIPHFLVAETDSVRKSASSLRADRVQQAAAQVCKTVASTPQLLEKILKLLVEGGMFDRAAILVLSKSRRVAEIHSVVGEGLARGERIRINDPISPLAACLTRVQSFSGKVNSEVFAPLGNSSFALSPVDVEHPSPVVLYADTSHTGPISFEARGIFRHVVGLVNRALQHTEGGLPDPADEQV